jgi:peptidoglycan/xylan/chitin deacetylase (PgdA/CDA1 family)
MLFLSKQDIAVLLFHRILPVRDTMWDPIDPLLFKKTLQYVQKKYHIVPLKEVLFENKTTSSKPLAAITFDDGYHDFIDYAVPIMDKFKITASMYVVSDCVDKNLPPWTYLLDNLFAKTKKLFWTNFDATILPPEYQCTKWNSSEERIAYCKKIKQYLKLMPAQQRNNIVTSALLNFDDVENPSNLMMSWEDIKQIHSAGFEIGSHSVTHPTLATIEEEESITFELIESARHIKEKTNIVSDIFSYPMGNYDERVKRLTQKAGYKAALAVNGKKYTQGKQDIFEIPRIELYNESWLKTKLRSNGTVSYIKQLKNK